MTEEGTSSGRFHRDVSEATKYIETALVIDKAMVSENNTAFQPSHLFYGMYSFYPKHYLYIFSLN